MPSITLRNNKNSPLSFSEADNNIIELDNRTKKGWFDLQSPIYTRPGGNSPGFVSFKGRITRPELEYGKEQEVFCDWHINHDWKPGSMLYPHVHFTTKSNMSGNIMFHVEYTYAAGFGSTKPSTFCDIQEIMIEYYIPPNSAGIHFIAEAAEGYGIPGTNLEVDSVIMGCIHRHDGMMSNEMTDSVILVQADLHYEKDRMSTPNRKPNFYG